MLDFFRAAILLIIFPNVAASWNAEELALYDLVEEINSNFYDLFGIARDASVADIKKAYRRLSLEWHPDRNSAPDASEKFRQIVSIYEVLKSTELREKYNNVLEYGLPDWRQPIYYYRKMRKLAWYEAVLVLVGVSTVAHYLMMWAAYYEKYLVLSQKRKSRKREKKGEPECSTAQIREALEVYRPRFYGLLPFLIIKSSWEIFMSLILLAREYMAREELVEEEEVAELPKPPPIPRPPEFTYEMATDLKPVSTNNPELYAKYMSEHEESCKKNTIRSFQKVVAGFGQVKNCINWSGYLQRNSLQVSSLSSSNNYRICLGNCPSLWIVFGTPNRWECMARVLNRSAQDITAMAGKLKHMKQDEYEKLAMGQQSSSVMGLHGEKVCGTPNTAPLASEWSQIEQKQLEAALQQYPKGCEDRWDKIASAVPTKSKEQCQQRLKELIELVRRKKASAQGKA
ncbi:DnaJ subfamily C member 1 [Trichostrongylus colubriformis]|uniref:DnaJ subfamily C member 1 n=1 Tax=Trichostrongylus colubriformis TaxID=6319 RepID=A0AAN8FVV0_TRICO